MQLMTNLATTLKAEISRVARKELRGAMDSLRKAVSHQRSEIAALKRKTAELERLTRQLMRVSKTKTPSPEIEANGGGQLRFQAKGFGSLRKKLGLSAQEMAKLLGVSSLSVYKWESGKATPRNNHLQTIAGVRKLGKREALSKLAEL